MVNNLLIRSNTLPETNIFANENRADPKRKGSYSNHPFSGAFDVSFREGNIGGAHISQSPTENQRSKGLAVWV